MHAPPLLILDEPTSGLAPIVSRTFEEAVRSLAAAGKCVLFSTHLLAQAEDVCSRIGVIGRGRVLAEGTIPELCALTDTQNLRQAFFKLVDRAPIDASLAPIPGAFPVMAAREAGVMGSATTLSSPARNETRGADDTHEGGDHAV